MSRYFDGVDDKVAVSDSSVFKPSNSLSCLAWVRVGTSAGWKGFIRKERAVSVESYALDSSGADVRWLVRASGGSNYWVIQPGHTWTAGVWYFLAGTVNVSGNSMHLYVDEVDQGAKTVGGAGVSSIAYDTLDLNFGRQEAASTSLEGNLAYCHIYNRSLSLNEIRQLRYFPASITNGLVGFWPLWGTSSPEPDYSGNGNHGTVTGAIAGTTEPPINGIFHPTFWDDDDFGISAGAPPVGGRLLKRHPFMTGRMHELVGGFRG